MFQRFTSTIHSLLRRLDVHLNMLSIPIGMLMKQSWVENIGSPIDNNRCYCCYLRKRVRIETKWVQILVQAQHIPGVHFHKEVLSCNNIKPIEKHLP